jgi:hypothetical protein
MKSKFKFTPSLAKALAGLKRNRPSPAPTFNYNPHLEQGVVPPKTKHRT